MGSVYDWSQAAADNATADDSINWAEGQPPSSVNNSARMMMARLRQYVTDTGGDLPVGGTAQNMTLAVASALKGYVGGLKVRFYLPWSNAANATLNINNLGALPIFKASAEGLKYLTGNEMRGGSIGECTYMQHGLNGKPGFLLTSPIPQEKQEQIVYVPAGAVMPFAIADAPAGWRKCNGDWLPMQDYPALYAAIGKRFGGNDWQFAVPDLRGEFIRGWVDNRNMGSQNGRQLGSYERDKVIYHRHRGQTDGNGGHNHTYSLYNQGSADGGDYHRGIGGNGRHNEETGWSGDHSHSFTSDWGFDEDGRMGDETRPRNIAMLYCIKL